MTPTKVLIDTDPGVDDAMAVLYAAFDPAIELVGLTSIFGNVTTEIATRNALALVEMTGLDIPVAAGATRPLVQEAREVAWEVHGREGFGDVPAFTPKRKPAKEPAHELICKMADLYEGELVLCPVGPLTNLALALEHDPSLASKVKSVTVMGGSLDEGGNVTPHAEANIWQDPHAAEKVFSANWEVSMIGLDVTHRIICSPADFAALASASPKFGGFLDDAAQFYFDFHRKVDGIDGCHMHDPTAVISIVAPQFVSFDETPVGVILDGEETGKTIRYQGEGRMNTRVASGIDANAVRERFLDIMKSAPDSQQSNSNEV